MNHNLFTSFITSFRTGSIIYSEMLLHKCGQNPPPPQALFAIALHAGNFDKGHSPGEDEEIGFKSIWK